MPYKVDVCQNNANKFYSKAECQEYCGKTEDDGEVKQSARRRDEKSHSSFIFNFLTLSDTEFLAANLS